jgi:hypothetical protein
MERVALYVHGNIAGMREDTSTASFPQIEAGDGVIVGYRNNMPAASGKGSISTDGVTRIAAIAVGESLISFKVLREDMRSVVAGALVSTQYLNPFTQQWRNYDRTCITNSVGVCSIRLQSTELPHMEYLETAKSAYRMTITRGGTLLGETEGVRVRPPPCCNDTQVL